MVKIIIGVVAVVLVAGGAYMLLNKDDVATENNQSTQTADTNSSEQTSEVAEQPKAEVSTVDGAIVALTDGGLSVGEKQGAFYDMIGAENGDKVDVDGTVVEMYEFSTTQKAQEAVTQLQSEDNTTYANGTFVILIHTTDPAVVEKIQGIL
ncbi:hypothetical protein KC968_04800 [Candidatus Saccharibacteria bacterium]|nr:hypothetical protein [Candidatus Saccharibacteria bacterium]